MNLLRPSCEPSKLIKFPLPFSATLLRVSIHIEREINVTASGKNVDVVVVDGHMDPGHPEFAVNVDSTGGSRVIQYNWFSLNPQVTGAGTSTYVYTPYVDPTYPDTDGDGYPDRTINNDHGTHVAGITAASGGINGVGINTAEAEALNSTTTLGTNVSKTVIGTSINLTATTVNTLFGANTSLQTTITIIGRDSGARVTIPVTIIKVNQ